MGSFLWYVIAMSDVWNYSVPLERRKFSWILSATYFTGIFVFLAHVTEEYCTPELSGLYPVGHLYPVRGINKVSHSLP